MFFGAQKKLEKILAEAEKAQRKQEGHRARKLFNEAADLLTEQGEFDRAIEVYQKAGTFEPAAELAEFSGQWAQAATLWLLGGRSAAAGRAELKNGNRERAAALLEKGGARKEAAEIHESLGQYWRAAELYERLGDKVSAASNFLRASGQHSDPPQIWRRAARLLMEAEQFADAIRIFDSLNDPEFAGRLLTKAGQTDQAIEYFRKAGRLELAAEAARKGQDELRAQLLSAEAATQREDWHRAAVHFEEAGYLEEAINHYRRSGDALRAAQLCERLRDFLRAASFYRSAKRPVDAERCDRRAANPHDRSQPSPTPRTTERSSPQIVEELFRAVETLLAQARQGDRAQYAQVMDLLRGIGAEHPEYGRARKLLSEVLEEQGDHANAVEVLLDVVRLPKKTDAHVPAILRYGWLLERDGLTMEAIAIYKGAMRLAPDYQELQERVHQLQLVLQAGSNPDWSAVITADL